MTLVYFQYGSFFYVLQRCQTGNNCTVWQMFPFIYWFVIASVLAYLILTLPFHKPEPMDHG